MASSRESSRTWKSPSGRASISRWRLKWAASLKPITVVGSTAKVDTTTTATDTSISQSLLFNMPISRANAAVSMLNYAPGINSSSAFGGAAGTANALLVDGVDVRDPEGGTPWVFFNYNIIDQVQIGSLGQTAEMGGFSGAVINTVTKSGGNRFAGLFEHRYSSKSLRGDNVTDNKLNNPLISALNPSLKVTGIDKLNDYTVQMSGPIKENRAFFFGSIQRYSIREDPDGPAHHPHGNQPALQREADVAAVDGRQHRVLVPVRPVQPGRPDGPGRRGRHDGLPRGAAGLARVGLEWPVPSSARQ